MAELLKEIYNYQTISQLATDLNLVYPEFKTVEFVNDIVDEHWSERSLKARMHQIALNLGKYLPSNYEKALLIINQVIDRYPNDFNDFSWMYFPDFVETYGQNESDWDLSMMALEKFTQSSSSEFAVRQFIVNDEKRMMKQMLNWSKSKNPHVRRLASEGCRPRLPWGQGLPNFKNNPLSLIPILEQLKADESLYVRKSVANNLNDISKTHPELVIKIAKEWYGANKHTDWILKHGCRTLLKKGNSEALKIFEYGNSDNIKINHFSLNKNSFFVGQKLTFSFEVEVHETTKARLEYAIDYVKASGKRSRKIFKISEPFLNQNSKKTYTKHQSFADCSTRKHYAGEHFLTLIVNGKERDKINFEVMSI